MVRPISEQQAIPQSRLEKERHEWHSRYLMFVALADFLDQGIKGLAHSDISNTNSEKRLSEMLTEYYAIVLNTMDKQSLDHTDNEHAIRAFEELFPQAIKRIERLKRETAHS